MKTKLFLSLIAVGTLFTSCRREDSENVNQDRIYAEYRIVHDAAEGKSYARATFKFKDALGVNLELTDPAAVSFNGDELSWKNAFAYYEKDFVGVKASGTFSYTDLDDNIFTNSVVLNNSIAIPSALTTISQASAYELTWDGPALEEGESVIVTIDGIHENDTQVFSTDSEGATSMILPKNQLTKLGDGTATIFMERLHSQDFQNGTSVKGAVWSRYIAAKKSITIEP